MMNIKTTRVLDIKKAESRANTFEFISTVTAILALISLIFIVQAGDYEDYLGKYVYTTEFYVWRILFAAVMIVLSHYTHAVSKHIRVLIEESIHEENEKAWGRK